MQLDRSDSPTVNFPSSACFNVLQPWLVSRDIIQIEKGETTPLLHFSEQLKVLFKKDQENVLAGSTPGFKFELF